jgi:hypothetical protein
MTPRKIPEAQPTMRILIAVDSSIYFAATVQAVPSQYAKM